MQFLKEIKEGKYTWYHTSRAPSEEQRKTLAEAFGFMDHHVESTQQGKTPRPKIAVTKRYLYFVLHIPYLPKNRSKVAVCELNVFVTPTHLVTVASQGQLASLEEFFEATQQESRLSKRRLKHGPGNLCLSVFHTIMQELELLVDKQGEKVDLLHEEIFKTEHHKGFIEVLSLLRYNQIVLSSAIERQVRAFEILVGNTNPFAKFQGNTNARWHVFVEWFQTLSYELSGDMAHLEGLVKTVETLVSHRTNETIKILTVFSVIMLPLSVISGIFGMNFRVIPFSQTSLGFAATVVVMALVAISMLTVFRLKRWL